MMDDPLRESRIGLDEILDKLMAIEKDIRIERAFSRRLQAEGRGLQVAQAHLQQASSILRGHVLEFNLNRQDDKDDQGREYIQT